jgi:exodeoxyribonuclease V beta subunit
MQRSHYALQALLYSVALHRYLRWRVRGYAPARELAGVHYLFLRGMVGARAGRDDAPPGSDGPLGGRQTGDGPLAGSPTGVFSWEPPAKLIADLSELLDGR